MTLNFSYAYFIFTSNHDLQDLLIFGQKIDTWLIVVLTLFGLSSIAFVAVWFVGLFVERQSGNSMKQPWE